MTSTLLVLAVILLAYANGANDNSKASRRCTEAARRQLPPRARLRDRGRRPRRSAAATVLLATVLGLPVSTTHALTGALVGAGLVVAGAKDVDPSKLGTAFLLPLLASPVIALVLAVVLYAASRVVGRRLGVVEESCVSSTIAS